MFSDSGRALRILSRGTLVLSPGWLPQPPNQHHHQCREVAAQDTKDRNNLGLVLPFATSWVELVFHLFVVRSQQLDSPRLQEAFREWSMKQGYLPICEASRVEVLGLPAVPQIGLFQVEQDISTIREYSQ